MGEKEHGIRVITRSTRLVWVAACIGALVAALTVALATNLAGGTLHRCMSQPAYGGAWGRQAAASVSAWRSGLLASVASGLARDPTEDRLISYARFDRFPVTGTCPPGQPILRYGAEGEGGKMLCRLEGLKPGCVIYSMGSRGDFSFERDVVAATPCHVHTFDCTSSGSSIDPRHTYHKVCIGEPPPPTPGAPLASGVATHGAAPAASGSNEAVFKTYAEVTAWLGHTSVDLVKMDIEGHEYRTLSSMGEGSARTLPRQLSLEVHLWNPEEGGWYAADVGRPTPHLALLFSHLAALGYLPVSREDNPNANLGCCGEWTFLRVEDPGLLGAATAGGGRLGAQRRALRA